MARDHWKGWRGAPLPGGGSGGFRAEPTVGRFSGQHRDSKQEAEREPVLAALEAAGQITELNLKPSSYRLDVYGTQSVHALLEWCSVLVNRQELQGNPVIEELRARMRTVERSLAHIGGYTPDFAYRDHRGELVVEDVKGWKISRDFPLRKKLMAACHNLEVVVVKRQSGVQQRARGAGIKGKGTGSRLRGGR